MSSRVLDIIAASTGLFLVSPILAISAVLIKLDGGPVFFRQDRVGRDGRLFRVFKLRSMVVDADRFLDAQGRPTRDRITKVGHIIRKLSIDELPQFLNILLGDMSLIGPRPILPMMLLYMTEREHERLSVRPGITGLAQIKGRNQLKWSRRFKYDIIYSRRQSLALDMWIVWQTVKIIALGKGVAQDRNPGQVNDITTRPLPEARK